MPEHDSQVVAPPGIEDDPERLSAVRDRRRGEVLERLGSYDVEPAAARAALAAASEAGFERLMVQGREYLEGRAAQRPEGKVRAG